MTDRERLLQHLIQHGSITSYEARVQEISGNPSERVRELVDAGHWIDIEHGYRISRGKKRPCARYILVALAETSSPELVAGGQVKPKTSPPSSPPPAPTPLFEVPADHARIGHIDVDQRDAA